MIKIVDKYKPLYYSDKRYFILTGGRGSGKTFAVQDYIIRLLEQKGQGILYTRYTMTSAEKTIIPLMVKHIELISDLRNYHITKTHIFNKRTKSFIMFSGIKTSSGDQTGNLKTLPDITTWVIEEGEDYNKESSFTDIDDSIRDKNIQNRIIWIQNPTTKEHFIYQKFFDGHCNYEELNGFRFQRCTHPNVEHIHTTYLDNIENLNDEKVIQWERIKTTNPKKYENKYIGAWLDKAEGVIFENWREGSFDESLPYIYGMDFGYTDPTVIVKVALDKEKRNLYVKEYLYQTELKPSQVEELLFKLVGTDDLVVADNANPNLIREYYDKGINIEGCRKELISTRIQKAQDWNIIVDPDSHNIKKELNNYAWHNKKAEIPMDNGFDHAIDSMFYAKENLERAGYSINW